MLYVKGILFITLLVAAAVCDLRKREIPNIIPVLLIPVGFICFNPLDAVFGLIVSGLPYFIAAIVIKKAGTLSVGGGDVKLMAACGFVLGYGGAIVHNIISLSLVIIVGLNLAIYKKEKFRDVRLPLAPFFCAGGIFSCLALTISAIIKL